MLFVKQTEILQANPSRNQIASVFDEKGDEQEQIAAYELEGPEHGLGLLPCPHEPALALSASLCRKALAAY